MKPAPSSSPSTAPAPFTDGLGARVRLAERGGDELEVLRLAREFVAVPTFEFALRERVGRLAGFRHASYARVRRVDRFDDGSVLGIVSEHAAGVRLSEILARAEERPFEIDISAALCLVRQLVPAIAALHEVAREIAHGAMAPERLLVTSQARVIVTDYVLGSAIDQLRLSRERLWKDLRIAVPPGAGSPRLDHRADLMQVGVASLSLILGRPLQKDELRAIPELVGNATAAGSGANAPISAGVRRWLLRMLQADPRGSFETAADAQQALEEVLGGEDGYAADPAAVEMLLARYHDNGSAAIIASDDDRPGTISRQPPTRPSESAHKSGPVRLATARVEPRAPLPNVGSAVTPSELVIQPFADAPQSGSASHPAPVPARPRSALPSSGDTASRLAVAKPSSGDTASKLAVPKPPSSGDTASKLALSSEAAAARAADRLFGVARAAAPSDFAEPAPVDPRRRVERLALTAMIVLALGEALFIWSAVFRDGIAPHGAGSLSVESRPAGVAVIIDGQARGTTPVSVRLRPGAHVLELRAGEQSRVLPVTIRRGESMTQYVELSSVHVTGTLDVRDAPGARVRVDGQLRGTSPVRIAELAPGTHEVVLEGRGWRARQVVRIQSGTTTTLRNRPGEAAAVLASGAGWLKVVVPFDVDVLEDGKPLGAAGDGAERLALPAGKHQLELVSEPLAFRSHVDVEVVEGQSATVNVVVPTSTLHIEADALSDVTIDGAKVGITPIAPLTLPIGSHTVVVSHPHLGRQRREVTVTAGSPARLVVNLQQKSASVLPHP
jgi:hypothetical protein